MVLSVIIWKGFWDMASKGVLDIFKDKDESEQKMLSYITTGVSGYAVFFILVLIKENFSKVLKVWKICFGCKLSGILLLDLIDIIAYCSIVLIWRTVWDVYDDYLYELRYKIELVLPTHFGSFLFVSLFGLTSVLFSPDVASPSKENDIPMIKFNKEEAQLSFETNTDIY